MALIDCINKLKTAGKLSEHQAKKIRDEADRLENVYRTQGKFGEEDLRARAESDALNRLLADVKQKEISEAIQLDRMAVLTKEIESHPQGPIAGLRDELRSDPARRHRADLPDIEDLSKGVFAHHTAPLNEFLEEFRSKIPGGIDTFFRTRRANLEEVVRARFGAKDIPVIYQRYADTWGEAVDGMLNRLSDAGVPIHKLDNWGMPQRWNIVTLRKVGKETWTKDIIPRLDRSKMLSPEGRALSEDEIAKLVDDVYETIITDGLNKIVREGKGLQRRGATIKSKREAQRVLHFKSADDWLHAFNEYAQEDVFDMMMEYLVNLSHDVAFAEKFGPNPDKTFRFLNAKAQLHKITSTKKRGLTEAGDVIVSNQMIYNVLAGKTEGIANPRLGNIAATLRNISNSAVLGGSGITAISDQGFTKATTDLLGLSYIKTLKNFIRNIIRMDGRKEKRELATRFGFLTDYAHGIASSAGRFVEVDAVGGASKLSARFVDFTVRAGFLHAMTINSKRVFHQEVSSTLASLRKLKLDDVPDKLKFMLESNSITSKDWNAIRKATTEVQGVRLIDPEKLDPKTSSKYLAMIVRETQSAVPEPNAEIRALFTRGQAKGTVVGEISKTLASLKGFPFTVMHNNLVRTIFHPQLKTMGNKFSFAVALTLYTTLLGNLSSQIHQITLGKDLLDPMDINTWTRSAAKGGGFGYLTDVILGTQKNPKEELAAIAGPVAMMALQVMSMMRLVPQDILNGDDPNFGSKLLKLISRYSPGNNVFYLQLALKRLVFDQLKELSDPKANRAWRRNRKRLKKKTGQQYYWEPGKLLPNRPPKISDKK